MICSSTELCLCVPLADEDFMAPLNGPDLVRIYATLTYAGTIPEELGLFDTPSLVFRLEDQSSPGDYVYWWMVDVQFDLPSVSLNPPVVNLTAYSCRTVSVSYAFATTMGLSEYSTATVIDVPGTVHEQIVVFLMIICIFELESELCTFAGIECGTVPQLEDSEVDITYVPDEREGFFTHMVWNVAWNLTSCTCLCTHDLGCLR